jgi:hypothetical protein
LFAGHIGAALAIGRVARQVNVGVLITSALLLDLLLWSFVLVGWESVTIPDNFAKTHQPAFVFPYSHSVFASIGWATLAGTMGYLWYRRGGRQPSARVAALIAAAVLSHWLLDALVHRTELPLAGLNSMKFGFGLWQSMPVALIVEGAIVIAGICLFLPGTSLSRAKSSSVAVLCIVILAFTIMGMTLAPPPPSSLAMAGSSLVTLVVVCALACWLGRLPGTRQPAVGPAG